MEANGGNYIPAIPSDLQFLSLWGKPKIQVTSTFFRLNKYSY